MIKKDYNSPESNKNVLKLLLNVKHDKKLLNDLIEIFDIHLKEKTKLLTRDHNYIDAYNDLILDFIEMVIKIPNEKILSLKNPNSYIIKSIHNNYIEISKRQSIYKKVHLLCDEVSECLSKRQSEEFDELYIDKNISFSFLTDIEYFVIKMFYFERYSISEIAKMRNVSRQAINQYKNIALNKIKDSIDFKI